VKNGIDANLSGYLLAILNAGRYDLLVLILQSVQR
jgi:hypothetical protein